MSSKGEKLRAHRVNQGRPRRIGVVRFENGKIDYGAMRRETEDEVKSTAIKARMRLHDLNKREAESPHAGYTLGRIFLDGKITERQLEAGNEYALAMARYYLLLGVSVSVRAFELYRVSGYSGEITSDYQQAMCRATASAEHYDTSWRKKFGSHWRQIRNTVFDTAFMDLDAMRFMTDRQIRLLRGGLDSIIEQWSCTDRKKRLMD